MFDPGNNTFGVHVLPHCHYPLLHYPLLPHLCHASTSQQPVVHILHLLTSTIPTYTFFSPDTPSYIYIYTHPILCSLMVMVVYGQYCAVVVVLNIMLYPIHGGVYVAGQLRGLVHFDRNLHIITFL